MKQILKYLKEYKKECICAPLFKLLEASFELIVPLVMAAIIDNGIAASDKPYIWKMGGVLVLLAAVGLVTHIATAAAATTWMLIDWIVNKKPTTVGACTGAVAGLVAITPAAGSTDIFGAFCIGIISTIVCFFMVAVVKEKFKYDDALDAFGVHGMG